MKRRTWLLSALGATGALVVGWGVAPPRSRLGSGDLMLPTQGDVALNGWIKIGADGTVTMAMNHCEMGQGVHTGLAQLVAEELEVDTAQVRLEQAGYDTIYGNVASVVGNVPFGPMDSEPGRASVPYRLGAWLSAKVGRELGIIVTGGSSAIADSWGPVRLAAATARWQLLNAAARQHGLDVASLNVVGGVVFAAASAGTGAPAKSLGHYGLFARAAAGLPVQGVRVKDPAQWVQIGQSKPRTDLGGKVNGTAQYGIDVRQPGQLYAAIRHCPVLGGKLGPANVDTIAARPGVVRVVQVPSIAGSTPAYAVIARTSWHALQAAQALEVQWQTDEAPSATPLALTRPDSEKIMAALQAQAQDGMAHNSGFVFTNRGDAVTTLASAAQTLDVVYSAPYLAHMAMEPINCTAQVKDGKVQVWAPTQVRSAARDVAARIAGVDVEAVTVHVTYLGGGFGRRLEVDFIGQAVAVAQEAQGMPVQLLWSREEDTTHDFYRPANVALMRAALDAQGQPLALHIHSAGDAMVAPWVARIMPERAGMLDFLNRNQFPDRRALAALAHSGHAPDKTASEGLFDVPYAFAHLRVAHTATHSGVPVGSWRSVGHSHNAFFSEGLVNELAHAANVDPVAFRLGLLGPLPRFAAVLQLAASKAGWGTPLPAGRARGVALHESFGTIVAQVAEVSVEAGAVHVHRVVCAVDCGVVVNPNLVHQQMESAVVFGLSATLFGKIDVVGGVVQQSNFTTQPVVQLAHCPVVQTHIVASTRAPSGMGEPGVPPIAPAVAQALFTLTGKRQRSLPLKA